MTSPEHHLHDFHATAIDGTDADLSQYDGDVVMIVNTASKCGLTPQYEGLQKLYDTYHDQGFTILGFPCDQFGGQEPGAEDEIASFCEMNYGVTFPMFAKIDVNGKQAHPIFRWLKDEQSGLLGGRIKWNFTKFLIGRDGEVLARYSPTREPASLLDDVEAALASLPVVGDEPEADDEG
jgi:glutathione peroxidase